MNVTATTQTVDHAALRQNGAEPAERRRELSDAQKEQLGTQYAGQPRPEQVELKQAVTEAQQSDEVQLSVRQDENASLNVNIHRPNGEQVLPYQRGSVLDTLA